MKEIDDRGPEFAAAYEPVKGGKHHKKLAGGLAARALLAAAMAGLLTLSVLTSEAEMRTPALYGGDPGNNAPPAVEAPEEPESPPPTTPPPTTPPPTTPPPTTPPPTTPPPTTPPPTTPPPTTPPPTTPPPYIPPYNPPPSTSFTAPSFSRFEVREIEATYGVDDTLLFIITVAYSVDIGSAGQITVTPSVDIPHVGVFSATPEVFFSSRSGVVETIYVPFDSDDSFDEGGFTASLSGVYKQNGADKTVSDSQWIPYG